jgi:asparagine synthase (glutamine-hydrolysing)
MCGISGLANWGNRATLARMNAVQAHRGPNDSGVWEHRSPDGTYIGLGSRRLSILDLSAGGHMPMSNEDGSIWITYNGEIYNFSDLRHELENKGHRFASNTDTEAIVHLYEELGDDCVTRLNGMFAFAICDLRGSSPRLLLARDHFGIKPLYYTLDSGRLAFASEAKALLQVEGVEPAIDLEALNQYLTFLWVPDPKTLFQGILKLPAGHRAIFCNGQFGISEYWDLSFPPADHEFSVSEDNLTEEVRERFRYSVEQQMVSDVPLGAFLSAGLDSSSIVATMAKAARRHYGLTRSRFPRSTAKARTRWMIHQWRRGWQDRWAAKISKLSWNPMSPVSCQRFAGTWTNPRPILRFSRRISCAGRPAKT